MSGSSTEFGAGLAPLPTPERVDGVDRFRAVEYRAVPGHRPLLLDLHRPAAPSPAPLIVFVHGGGWRVGSRATFGPLYADWSPSPFARLAARGCAVASLDYRLSGEAVFPAPLDDVTAGLAWLREHAGDLGVDASRIVLWGESAGAHLAALVGLRDGDVRAVVDWYGPADLTTVADDAAAGGLAIADPGAADSRESALLGGTPSSDPSRARAASPVAHVRPHAPPFLVLHGTADRFVPARQSQRLAAALESSGAPVRLELIDGADHLWLGRPDVAASAFTTSAAFALQHLEP
jgi:acetyl esterase/lipase